MFFNNAKSIWILAVLLLILLALAGWRQGGILAAFSFGGILFGALFAVLIGKIFHFILPHLGASDPLVAWALAPVCGFILVEVIFMSVGFKIHRQVEVNYKHRRSELQLALWTRLNTRLGICVGLLNGAAYFILISFLLFNLTYLTTQVAVAGEQPLTIRVANRLGHDLQSTGISTVAAGVGTLSPAYYQFSDLAGFLMQNPQAASRFADYPGFTSLWQRDDMQALATDGTLTNALAAGATLGQVLNEQPVQDFLKNKDLNHAVTDTLQTNLDDLTAYLQTGKSAKFDDKIIGEWDFNLNVTLAWFRQNHPRVQASEMKAARAIWTEAYSQTTILATGDNQLFIKNLPHFTGKPGKPDLQDWKGDWSTDGANYTLHATLNGQDKFMEGKADALRLSVKDGKDLLIFDRAD
jgi:hypothetical protein